VGSLPIRAYALCIVLGIVAACVITDMRMRRRGAPPFLVLDLAVWSVPFGIVGARIYHVITSPQAYFGSGGHPLNAFKIWEGGLGIWGAVAGGAVGAWLACRQVGIPLTFYADTMAPGLVMAQAIGRWGNWFNNELHGGPTKLPWGLKVHEMDPDHPGKALLDADGKPILLPGLYHPTFLYESIWDVGVAVLVVLADRRYKFGKGRAFALYVMAYTVGRLWIEAMRTDEANHILGLRLNVFTSIVVFLGALIYFLRVKGPQEFLIPRAAWATGGDDDAPQGGAAPTTHGFRVVTEEQFRHYKATGEVPSPDTEADLSPPGDTPDPDEAATDEAAKEGTAEDEAGAAQHGDSTREANPAGDSDSVGESDSVGDSDSVRDGDKAADAARSPATNDR
jgi:prolipoprotein diacylglyceryl transferase